jgi:hypothetical protein
MSTIGNSSEIVSGISVASDGIYLTGGDFNGGLVQKYDKSGNQIWAKQFGSGTALYEKLDSSGRGISATSTGVYVAGTLIANQTSKGWVVFVREYDFVGNAVWNSDLTNASGVIVNGVYAGSSGVYVVGSIAGSLPGSSGIGNYDAFLVKYYLNGGLAWTRQFGTPQFEVKGYGVAGDPTGVYVSGTSMSSAYGFLRKYDFNGNLAWADRIDSPDMSGVGDSAVAVDSSGVYVSLSTNREFIMKYDLNGGRLWSFQMPISNDRNFSTKAYRLAAVTGRLYVAGSLPDASAGLVAEVGSSPSLVFFGTNPPLSFVLVGALIASAATGLFVFRKLRRGRLRPPRVGPLDRSLPVED